MSIARWHRPSSVRRSLKSAADALEAAVEEEQDGEAKEGDDDADEHPVEGESKPKELPEKVDPDAEKPKEVPAPAK